MTLQGLLLFILIVQAVHFAGTWKLYIKAGRQAWEAAVPVYNAVILMKIINRPWWYTLLLFVPIVNLIMFPVIWVETLRSFGKNKSHDTFLGIVTLGFYIYYINYIEDVNYVKDRDLHPRTNAGEWVSSILFAVVAATLVHTYVMQPFTIPTSSLEKTLLVGDYLFVSKFHYGARTPMTPIALPMVHDTIPFVKKKSYNPDLKSPYTRLPGFQSIKRNDIVVFNWPVDTLNAVGAPRLVDGLNHYKPIDKKTNYVKRCVGLPGDSLSVRDGYVHINGTQNVLPDRAKLQFGYYVGFSRFLTERDLIYFNERFDISDVNQMAQDRPIYLLQMTDQAKEKFQNHPDVTDIVPLKGEAGVWDRGTFPYNPRYPWNNDHFGPIYIPQKGATVEINTKTISLYKRIIEVYEGSEFGVDQTITESRNQVLLNGQPITEYTFLQDYYWMMGDNRNNSEDARTWGFVPYNHVIGKPVFVWMSWDGKGDGFANKVRWERLFTTVGGSGEPVSYFKLFLGLLVAWFVFDFFRKRRKKAKA
ncbi:MAG: signal peptidase I [Gilvibacter sp.]